MKRSFYIWSLVERFGTSGVSFLGNIVLAALLTPADFGLVAMLGIFTAVIADPCRGMSDALLREPEPSERDFSTLFIFNTAIGAGLTLLFALCAPLVARYFGRPELQPVMATLGLVSLLNGLSIAQATRLRSQLRFRASALCSLASIVSALAVAITMAAGGLRHWSLVELQVGYSAFFLLYVTIAVHRLPRWKFDRKRLAYLWHFGANLMLATIVEQMSNNVFAFILGRNYSPTQAGLMTQAQKLQQTPVNAVEASISGTTYAITGKLSGKKERAQSLLKMFRWMALANTAVCTVIAVLAKPIVEALFPERWIGAVPYLQLLLLWALVYPAGYYMQTVFKTFDRTDIIRNVFTTERLLILAAAFLLIPWGLEAVIIAATLISLGAVATYFALAARVAGIKASRWWTTFLGGVLTASVVAMPAAIVVAVIGEGHPWWSLIAGLAAWLAFALPTVRMIGDRNND